MFWIVFVIAIVIIGVLGMVMEFFEQMKESEYEFVRVAYWFFVTAFWITVLIWLWSF